MAAIDSTGAGGVGWSRPDDIFGTAIEGMLKRLTNGEFVLAMVVASIFWIAVLVWATSYVPTDPEKAACYHSAEKSGRSTEECKSFWEKTTSDPVAMFTLVLAVSTIGLWSATIFLYRTGEKQIGISSQVADLAEKQLAIIGLQTDIQRKQHAIGRLQFIAAHRPLLRVRYFKLLSTGTEPIQIAFTVANVGTGTARLLGSCVAVEFFSPIALLTSNAILFGRGGYYWHQEI
jgi:hypothetical protein